jgi:prepilin-type N-terminal cleavage/methylation domain-containing protein
MALRERGFTLIELLIVIAIIALIAAISMPGLRRARLSANEASAITSLRAVNSAQSTFAAACGKGFFAPSLAALGTPPTTGDTGSFIGSELATDPSVKSGYVVTLTPGDVVASSPASCNGSDPGMLVSTYFVGGEPVGGEGARFFGTNQEGTIYESTAAIPPTQTGAPDNATPIR